jgi:protein TonB
VKIFSQLTPLSIAVAASVLLHGTLLAVRFAAPEAFQLKPADPGLEVILVNARHKKPPVKADALAQANLDGGGNADAGRSMSPLPDLQRSETGDSVQATQRRIAELEEAQNNLLTQTRKSLYTARPVNDKDKPDPASTGTDLAETSKAIARPAAEIIQRIEDQNKRPKKTFITPSTREVGYAMYYKEMQKRIEEMGTLNFPQHNGKKMYGELVVYIPIFQDGTIYQKDGGVRIEKSSGNPDLDKATLAIVRRAAPFGRFPHKMRTSDKDDLWVIITRFNFTHQEKLETELRGQ